MKAITLKQTGGIENLQIEEVEIPQPKPNEVLIKVKAISVNPVDAFVRQNEQAAERFLQVKNAQETIILGWDISGVVEETGDQVLDFRKGDEVFGLVNFVGHGKGYAEYVAAPQQHLALKPSNISHEEAAAATLAALTAWQALVPTAKVKEGDRVLIHAAAGGVGHYAVQIAKHFGAFVIATASAAKRDFVLELGADEFIDYRNEQFEEKVENIDIVVDPIAGNHLLRSLEAVKQGGKVISLKTFIEGEFAEKAKEKNVFAERIGVRSNGADQKAIADLLKSGDIKSHISEKYAFRDLPKAHAQIETGKTLGKLVVTL